MRNGILNHERDERNFFLISSHSLSLRSVRLWKAVCFRSMHSKLKRILFSKYHGIRIIPWEKEPFTEPFLDCTYLHLFAHENGCQTFLRVFHCSPPSKAFGLFGYLGHLCKLFWNHSWTLWDQTKPASIHNNCTFLPFTLLTLLLFLSINIFRNTVPQFSA